MIVNLLRVLHSCVIGLIIFKMVQRTDLSAFFMYGEIALTITRSAI